MAGRRSAIEGNHGDVVDDEHVRFLAPYGEISANNHLTSCLPCIGSPHGARIRLCRLRGRPVTLPHMTPGPATPEIGAATDVLRNVFGYDSFRPGQQEVIGTVLAGRDCIAVMPTGAGKSLTFQIPARILPGTVLVLSPLISLMKDLRNPGIRDL